MRSGSPEPANDLSLIMNMKRNQPGRTVEVVSEASRWLKSQFSGAGVAISYSPCEEGNPSTFATMSVIKELNGRKLVLSLKIAEIGDKPFVFAEIIPIGNSQGSLFPFFADLSTDEAKQSLLHYVSDFLLT